MTEKESQRSSDVGDHESLDPDEPDWQVRGDEHPLEGGQTDAVDDLQEDDSLADGSSYRKEADGLDDLVDDGSNYRRIAEADE